MFTELLNNEIRTFDPEVPMLAPKDCMFRIFRDVRFSNDKRPYKTNTEVSSLVVAENRDMPDITCTCSRKFIPRRGCLYAAARPAESHPQEIYPRAGGILWHIKDDPEFQKHLPDEYDDKLKTAPRDFPKDWEYIHLLRNKSYAYGRNLTEEEILSPSFMENILETFKVLSRMNHFFEPGH